ncbi:hypothetical protein Bca4012_010256 [Brassica carinata]
MKKWKYAKLITLALLCLILMILLLAFQGISRAEDHQHIHAAIGNKDISMGREAYIHVTTLNDFKSKTESMKMMGQKRDGSEYLDQEHRALLETMHKDYPNPNRSKRKRKAPINN